MNSVRLHFLVGEKILASKLFIPISESDTDTLLPLNDDIVDDWDEILVEADANDCGSSR